MRSNGYGTGLLVHPARELVARVPYACQSRTRKLDAALPHAAAVSAQSRPVNRIAEPRVHLRRRCAAAGRDNPSPLVDYPGRSANELLDRPPSAAAGR
jgi:hypothetical protein